MIPTRTIPAAALAAAVAASTPATAQETEETWLPSLVTDTPAEGFDLAVAMARRAVKTTQPDVTTLKAQRPDYAHDAESLIEVSGVVAAYFDTIAEANDHWRE